jgi:hypothetical protein
MSESDVGDLQKYSVIFKGEAISIRWSLGFVSAVVQTLWELKGCSSSPS